MQKLLIDKKKIQQKLFEFLFLLYFMKKFKEEMQHVFDWWQEQQERIFFDGESSFKPVQTMAALKTDSNNNICINNNNNNN